MVSTLKVNKIQIPNSDSDVISLDASTGNVTLNKTLGGTSITVQAEGTATTNLQQGLNKAWVSFVGTSTITVSDSFNLSSLVDDETGTYTANINNDMANDAYCWSASMKDGTTQGRGRFSCPRNASTYSASAFQMEFQNDNSDIMQDVDHGALVITGDLA